MNCDINAHLIKKIITASGNECPEFIYKNPLLDKTMARTLSRSLINVLKQAHGKTNFNSSLKHSLLVYICSLCKVEPKEHYKVDENVMNLITESYIQDLKTKTLNSDAEHFLDNFLIKEMKSVNINSIFNHDKDVEVIQALINLNIYRTNTESIYEHILHWNVTDKNIKLLKNLWNNDCLNKDSMLDSLSIKVKAEIESDLLECCYKILANQVTEAQDIFEDQNIINLLKKCSKSPHCFQICCSILNHIFFSTHFNSQLATFIFHFVLNIKSDCLNSISYLYQNNLKHIVIILDTDLTAIPGELKEKYSESAVKYLIELHEKSEDDLIMLLSHYPQWFDFYNAQKSVITS